MAEHLLKRFDEELNKLRYCLLKMGTLVQNQIEHAVSSLIDNNIDDAKLVIEYEQKVDKLDNKIEKQGLRIFALHQPVAMDLRLVLSAVSINSDMELIGDMATNIAKDVIEMSIPPGLIEKTKFKDMGELINSMAADLMIAYVNMDNVLAFELIKKDIETDKLFKDNLAILINLMKSDSRLVEICSYLVDINRNLHSISHQMRSVAQELVFLFDAKMIKHQSNDDS